MTQRVFSSLPESKGALLTPRTVDQDGAQERPVQGAAFWDVKVSFAVDSLIFHRHDRHDQVSSQHYSKAGAVPKRKELQPVRPLADGSIVFLQLKLRPCS